MNNGEIIDRSNAVYNLVVFGNEFKLVIICEIISRKKLYTMVLDKEF